MGVCGGGKPIGYQSCQSRASVYGTKLTLILSVEILSYLINHVIQIRQDICVIAFPNTTFQITAIVMPTSTVSALTAPSIRKNGKFLFSPFSPPIPLFVYPATSKGGEETRGKSRFFYLFCFLLPPHPLPPALFNYNSSTDTHLFFSLFGRKTLARSKIRIQTASWPKLLQRPSSRAQSFGSNESERKGNEGGEGS